MADTLVRSPSSRHAGAFRTRKTSTEPSQKAESCHYQLSKFVTGALGLTARSNPNWRTRPSSDDSLATSNVHQGKVRGRKIRTMASSSNFESKSQQGSGNHLALHPNVSTRSRALSGKRAMECPEYSEDEACYQVYKHIELGPFGFAGAPLALIDLGPQCDGNPQSLVKVRRFLTNPNQCFKMSENAQKEQLKAALRAGATTPCKSQSINEGHTSPNMSSAPAAGPDIQKTVTNRAHFDMAFQKMLQKLTRNVEQDRKDDTGGKIEKDQVSKPVHPMSNIGRRMNTVSDPCDRVMPAMPSQLHLTHKKEDTHDSGVCVEENCKSVLNPRAREFLTNQELLSFRNKECPPTISDAANGFLRSSPTQCHKACKHGRTPAIHASHIAGKIKATEVAPLCQPIPKTTPGRQTSPVTSNAHPVMTSMYGFAPFLLNNLLSSGSLLPLSADQTPGQGLGPASTALTALPALATQPALQPVAGTFSGFPQMPLFSPVFPSMIGSHVDPCVVAPACPLPAVGTVTTRPPPVPKPRRPDPKDQQAYEAWIEWRKANEPGYALECKLRQQRRAQRNTGSLSKMKPEKKTEASKSE